MFDELKAYTASAFSPELQQVIGDAIVVFDRINAGNYQDEYVNILMNINNVDITTTNDAIVAHTQKVQAEILLMHGIELSEGVSISDATFVINALLDIQSYDNPAELLKASELTGDPIEVLSDVISVTTHKTVEELMHLFLKVEPALITTIREFLASKISFVLTSTSPDNKKYIDSLKKYIAYLKHINEDIESLIITRLMLAGVGLGYSFETYAKMAMSQMDGMDPNAIAVELVGLAYVSEDGNENPLVVINGSLDNLFHDIKITTLISIKVNEVILDLNQTEVELDE